MNRNRPDLDRLRAVSDPEEFVWAVLPHAARTFSTCIAMLPADCARAAAAGYRYCRSLDTYEDLSPTPAASRQSMRAFAARHDDLAAGMVPPPPPPLDGGRARDARDHSHLLLVERSEMVDRFSLALPREVRELIRDLVTDMAEGMCESSVAFESQGGVLRTDEQIRTYCRAVIGHPILFTIRLLRFHRTGRTDLDPELREEAMRSSELVQLANITRDIEKDLLRGVAYRPELADDLGPEPTADPDRIERVRAARHALFDMAMARAPSYPAVVGAMGGRRVSLARASAILMLLFTDRYYRSCAGRIGIPPWPGKKPAWALVLESLLAAASESFAERIVTRVERDFLGATRPGAEVRG